MVTPSLSPGPPGATSLAATVRGGGKAAVSSAVNRGLLRTEQPGGRRDHRRERELAATDSIGEDAPQCRVAVAVEREAAEEATAYARPQEKRRDRRSRAIRSADRGQQDLR